MAVIATVCLLPAVWTHVQSTFKLSYVFHLRVLLSVLLSIQSQPQPVEAQEDDNVQIEEGGNGTADTHTNTRTQAQLRRSACKQTNKQAHTQAAATSLPLTPTAHNVAQVCWLIVSTVPMLPLHQFHPAPPPLVQV